VIQIYSDFSVSALLLLQPNNINVQQFIGKNTTKIISNNTCTGGTTLCTLTSHVTSTSLVRSPVLADNLCIRTSSVHALINFSYRQEDLTVSSIISDHKSAPVVNAHLVDDPTIRQQGFTLPRQQWSLLNRFRTGQGHCGACRKT